MTEIISMVIFTVCVISLSANRPYVNESAPFKLAQGINDATSGRLRAFCDGEVGCKCLIWIAFMLPVKTVSSSVEVDLSLVLNQSKNYH